MNQHDKRGPEKHCPSHTEGDRGDGGRNPPAKSLKNLASQKHHHQSDGPSGTGEVPHESAVRVGVRELGLQPGLPSDLKEDMRNTTPQGRSNPLGRRDTALWNSMSKGQSMCNAQSHSYCKCCLLGKAVFLDANVAKGGHDHFLALFLTKKWSCMDTGCRFPSRRSGIWQIRTHPTTRPPTLTPYIPFFSLGRLCQRSPRTVPVSLHCVGSTWGRATALPIGPMRQSRERGPNSGELSEGAASGGGGGVVKRWR